MDKNLKYGVSYKVDPDKYHSVRGRILRQDRASRGVCVRCGKNVAQKNKVRCIACNEIGKSINRGRRCKRQSLGLCVSCGKNKVQENTTRCAACVKRKTVITKGRKHERQSLGLCITCGKSRSNTSLAYCEVHNNQSKEGVKRRVWQRIEEGKCSRCNSSELVTGRMCFKHWLNDASHRATGCSSKKMVKKLWDIMLKQNMRCPYTGKELVPGKNASIDHRIPRSRGGSNDVTNLQWVNYTINVMKQDLLHDEFIEVIKLILANVNGR